MAARWAAQRAAVAWVRVGPPRQTPYYRRSGGSSTIGNPSPRSYGDWDLVAPPTRVPVGSAPTERPPIGPAAMAPNAMPGSLRRQIPADAIPGMRRPLRLHPGLPRCEPRGTAPPRCGPQLSSPPLTTGRRCCSAEACATVAVVGVAVVSAVLVAAVSRTAVDTAAQFLERAVAMAYVAPPLLPGSHRPMGWTGCGRR